MKKKTFIIRSDSIIDRLTAFLKSQPKKPFIEVIVQEYKKDRSLEQNQLYWRWITVISNELSSVLQLKNATSPKNPPLAIRYPSFSKNS